ncbi:MAG: hypothetical protein QGH66_01730 [Dehalococcoidia bacterium]|jgi:hypothetical protein|nr:hypothetical protein [Dehalococcoidia bacterium]MDP7239626.1 hypothetical protein [Dehalococcoidia bacterium]MDP7470707.1 hypothetical protein [Dehalococcoidia bacterium]
MTSLKFLLDSMCANFTERCLHDLVTIMVDENVCSVDDIVSRITVKDPSLDVKSAQTLAEGAVEALAQTGQVAVRDGFVCPVD